MKTVICLLCLFFTTSISAQIKNDLEIEGLKGKVKTIKTESAKMTKENDEIKADSRELKEQQSFDEHGFYTEWASGGYPTKYSNKYDSDGKIIEKRSLDSSETEVFKYQKNQVEKITQLEDGHILDRWIYTFDERGRIIKEQYILVDKNLGQRLFNPSDSTIYKYDPQGRLSETAFFNANGTGAILPIFSIHRYVKTYDDKDRLIEQQVYKPDGNLILKWTFGYNEKGYLVETMRFNQNLAPISKVTYSDFDAAGNYTKESSFNVSVIDGKTIIESAENKYRTIVYYP